jgi:hypothetical protein
MLNILIHDLIRISDEHEISSRKTRQDGDMIKFLTGDEMAMVKNF